MAGSGPMADDVVVELWELEITEVARVTIPT